MLEHAFIYDKWLLQANKQHTHVYMCNAFPYIIKILHSFNSLWDFPDTVTLQYSVMWFSNLLSWHDGRDTLCCWKPGLSRTGRGMGRVEGGTCWCWHRHLVGEERYLREGGGEANYGRHCEIVISFSSWKVVLFPDPTQQWSGDIQPIPQALSNSLLFSEEFPTTNHSLCRKHDL